MCVTGTCVQGDMFVKIWGWCAHVHVRVCRCECDRRHLTVGLFSSSRALWKKVVGSLGESCSPIIDLVAKLFTFFEPLPS